MFDPEELKRIQEKMAEWDKKTQGQIGKFPERKKEFSTISGIPVKRVYAPLDLEPSSYLSELGFPGDYPYTRGVQSTMYRGRFWTMRQYAGFATAEETNRRYRYLLDKGQTGLSVAFDLPTQIGYDSDHEMAEGEVGKVGVAIDSIEDMATLFDGIPLDKVTTSMTINAPASILLAMYIKVAERQGVKPGELGGTIQNDILKEYSSRGTYIFPPKPSMRIITDIFGFCTKQTPKWNMISISGYHMREAGCTAVQEVAFTLANAIAYVKAAIDAGLDVDEFAGRLSFFFNSHLDFLEEVAKFRAARRMWARIMKERFGAKKPGSWTLRFHTQTAGVSLTAQQPENNIVRTAMECMAAVLGGTNSLHTNSFDEALALPSEKSVQIALRTQQIVAHESGICETVDPLAGSYYVEWLTSEIERRAADYIEKIDRMGGSPSAIEQGYIQKEIQESAYRYQKEIERKERIIVGLNQFQIREDKPKDLLRVDPQVRQHQIEKIRELKAARDGGAVSQALAKLRKAAAGTDNLMPPILEAVGTKSTLGEICDTLRGVFGEYQAHQTI
ncbi:MAG: methylmalonyl-CoA mutase family protein [bacterium]